MSAQLATVELDSRHRYTVDGRDVPGVTEVLAGVGLADYSQVPAPIREAALLRGRYVHQATEYYDLGDLDETSIGPEIAPYLEAYKAFRAHTGFMPEVIERKGYSASLEYCGTLDRIGRLKGRRVLVDIKTGEPPAWVELQLAAYFQLAAEEYGQVAPERYCLQLTPSGYKLHGPYLSLEALQVFVKALTVYRWGLRNGCYKRR